MRLLRPALLSILPMLPLHAFAAMPEFTFRALAPVAPEDPPRETLSPADIDKDGDMDFFSGGTRCDWFENRGALGWARHVVSDSSDTDVGAVAADVDGDGWVDRVSGSFWHRNPGPPGSGRFQTHRFREGIADVHDQFAGDIDGDGRPDVVDIGYDAIQWFKNPAHPDSLWPAHAVNDGLKVSGPAQHGGIALGDVDGDGDLDVTRVDRWYENDGGKGLAWIEHVNIDFGINWASGYGLATRALIFDLDGDGRMDLVQSECDVPNGRVAWFRNTGKGLAWERHIIKDSTDGQDFHSLAAADFDGDGDLDLFSTGSLNSAKPPAAYIWENLDGKGGAWEEHVLHVGKEGHEATVMDIDGDGDADILVKSWTDGDHYYYENRRPGASAVRRAPSKGRAAAETYALPWERLFRNGRGLQDLKGRLRPPTLR